MALIPEDYAEAVCGVYYQERTLKALAEESGVSTEQIRQRRDKGISALRRGKCLSILKPYREDIIERYAYRSSLTSFRNDWMSSTERTVEILNERNL